MLERILQWFVLRFWKGHPQSELVCNELVCKRSNMLQHWTHHPCIKGPKFIHLYSMVVSCCLNTTNKYKPIGIMIILPFLDHPSISKPSLWSRVSSRDAWEKKQGVATCQFRFRVLCSRMGPGLESSAPQLSQTREHICQDIQVLVKNSLSQFSTEHTQMYPGYQINSLFWKAWNLSKFKLSCNMSKLSWFVPFPSTPAQQSDSRFSDSKKKWAVFHGHGCETPVSQEPRTALSQKLGFVWFRG